MEKKKKKKKKKGGEKESDIFEYKVCAYAVTGAKKSCCCRSRRVNLSRSVIFIWASSA